jgi:hypothetical protein
MCPIRFTGSHPPAQPGVAAHPEFAVRLKATREHMEAFKAGKRIHRAD